MTTESEPKRLELTITFPPLGLKRSLSAPVTATFDELVQYLVAEGDLSPMTPAGTPTTFQLTTMAGVPLSPDKTIGEQGLVDNTELRLLVPTIKGGGGDAGTYLLAALQTLGPNLAASALWDAVKYAWTWAHA